MPLTEGLMKKPEDAHSAPGAYIHFAIGYRRHDELVARAKVVPTICRVAHGTCISSGLGVKFRRFELRSLLPAFTALMSRQGSANRAPVASILVTAVG